MPVDFCCGCGPGSSSPDDYEEPPVALGLQKVAESRDIKAGKLVDIVAVHGLGGHPVDSWTWMDDSDASKRGKMWLRDFLCENINANIRVWTYGYNAQSIGTQSKAGIRNIAETMLMALKTNKEMRNGLGKDSRPPLILLGHSLGGLVIKQTILMAKELKTDAAGELTRHLYESIFGVVFLGTPHFGALAADLADALIKAMKFCSFNTTTNDKFVKVLKTESDALLALLTSFRSVGHLKALSVYENNVTPGVPFKIVTEASSRLHWPSEEVFGMDCDHKQLARFKDASDPNFKLLLASLENMVEEASKGIRLQKDDENKLLLDLNATYNTRKSDMERTRCLNTCEWVLDVDVVSAWLKSEASQTIWFLGEAGSGKSFATSFLLQQIPSTDSTSSDTVQLEACMVPRLPSQHLNLDGLVLHYFFHTNPKAKLLTNALKSILGQILNWEPRACRVVKDRFPQMHDDIRVEDLGNVIYDTLRALHIPLVYLVIDGLDECEQRGCSIQNPPCKTPGCQTSEHNLLKPFLKAVFGLREATPRIKILITSRPTLYETAKVVLGQDTVAESVWATFHPHRDSVRKDISRFVEMEHEKIRRKTCGMSIFREEEGESLVQAIPDVVRSKADDCFLVASLSMSLLADERASDSLGGMEHALLTVKGTRVAGQNQVQMATLVETYKSIIGSLEEDYRSNILRLFKLLSVSLSKNDISLEVARHILAFDSSVRSNKELVRAPVFIAKEKIRSRILQICGPFIKLSKGVTVDGETVSWYHLSAQEFLLIDSSNPEQQKDEVLKNWQFDIREAELEIALICLRYLSFRDFTSRLPPTDTAEISEYYTELIVQFPLLQYAAYHWADHVRNSTETLIECHWAHVTKFAQNRESLRMALYLHWSHAGVLEWKKYPKSPSWLHVFSYFGMDSFIDKMLLENIVPLPEFDPSSKELSPLKLASLNGHVKVVRLLLDKGLIDVKAETKDKSIDLAIEFGHHNVVEFLCEQKQEVVKSAYALQFAALQGYEGVISYLHDKGIIKDIDEKLPDPDFGSALEAASLTNQEATVKLLLKLGAMPDGGRHVGNKFGPPLHAASFSGFTNIMRILIERGADVNKPGGAYHTALQAAAFNGKVAAVKLLIEKGARVNEEGGKYVTALDAAYIKKDEEIIMMLKKAGAKSKAHADNPVINEPIQRVDSGIFSLLNLQISNLRMGNSYMFETFRHNFELGLLQVISSKDPADEVRIEQFLIIALWFFEFVVKANRPTFLNSMAEIGMDMLQAAVKHENQLAVNKLTATWTTALVRAVEIKRGKDRVVRAILERCLNRFTELIVKEDHKNATDAVKCGIEIYFVITARGNVILMKVMSELWVKTFQYIIENWPPFTDLVIQAILVFVNRFRQLVKDQEFVQMGHMARTALLALEEALDKGNFKVVDRLMSVIFPILDELLREDEGTHRIYWLKDFDETVGEMVIKNDITQDFIWRILHVGSKLALLAQTTTDSDQGDRFRKYISLVFVNALSEVYKTKLQVQIEQKIKDVVEAEFKDPVKKEKQVLERYELTIGCSETEVARRLKNQTLLQEERDILVEVSGMYGRLKAYLSDLRVGKPTLGATT